MTTIKTTALELASVCRRKRLTYVMVSSSVVVDTGVPPELVDSPSA